jgi:endonuclease YncB( thermonuclease family)
MLKEKPLVYIRCGKFDKYGRLLGDIFINKKDKISVNELMVANGYGYKYHGGTKKVNPGVLISLV